MTASLIELPPAPRRLRRRPGIGIGPIIGRWVVRLFIMPHCIAGIGLICVTLLYPVIVTFGDDVPGRITATNTSTGKGGRRYYHLKYSFLVNGTDYSSGDNVGVEEYDSTHIGDHCTVRVFSPYPKLLPQRLSSKSLWLNWPGYLLMTLFWNGILSLFVWMVWISPWRVRQLLKYGTPVAGQITAKKETRTSKGGRSWQAEYVYQPTIEDHNGTISEQLLNGKMTISEKDYDSAKQGQIVTVLFSPRRPKRSLVYDFADYVAVE